MYVWCIGVSNAHKGRSTLNGDFALVSTDTILLHSIDPFAVNGNNNLLFLMAYLCRDWMSLVFVFNFHKAARYVEID